MLLKINYILFRTAISYDREDPKMNMNTICNFKIIVGFYMQFLVPGQEAVITHCRIE